MIESPQTPAPVFTRYSVESSRDEERRERRSHTLWWALIAGACVVIVAMAYLLVSGGLV